MNSLPPVLLLDQLVAGLARKGLEVAHRTGVGGDDLEHLAADHVGQGLLGLQDRQRAVQASGVDFLVDVHGVSCVARILDIQALNGSMKRGSWPRARSQSASA
jgi:hypothetical protein